MSTLPSDTAVTTAVGSLHEYIKWTESVLSDTRLMLFRGQSVKGNLLPGVARKTPTYDSTNVERLTLDQFRLMGASMLPNVITNTLELLVVAQHYGLKTRLLDWTRNPLAALYFACEGLSDSDAYVYALQADDIMAADAFAKDPFSATKTRVFQPPLNNPRIIAQQGWFTLHIYSEKAGKFVPLERNSDTKDYVTALRIPAQFKVEMLKSLSMHGVGPHTLYPDLGGLSKHLNLVHGL